MRTARFYAQATTLTDGKVLITGGNQFRSVSFPDAEIFDPATATFTSVPNNMLQLRSGHTATLLNDGRVLIAGGDNAFPSLAEIFDPIAQTFTPTAPMAQRRGHTATKLGDGRVLIVGGDFSPFTAEVYDPIANTWTATGSAPVFPHSGHTATLLCDGSVFIAGGGSFSGSSSRNTEIFSPSSGSFIPVSANMGQFRGLHSATLLSCSEVLIVGGDNRFPATAEIFNTATQLFTPIAPTNGPQSPRTDHVAKLLDNGDVVIIGGSGGFSSIEVFRATTRSFQTENLSFFSSVLFARGSAAAAYQSAGNCPTCSSGHKILVAGGTAGCSLDGSIAGTDETFVYVPTNMSPPPPSITSVSPASAGTGGGATVTITGANFQTGASVSVGSTLMVTSVTPTQIVGTTKARDAGAASVSVTNPDSQFGSLASAFTYVFRPAGDANGDGTLSVGDIFYLINHLFAGGPPPIN